MIADLIKTLIIARRAVWAVSCPQVIEQVGDNDEQRRMVMLNTIAGNGHCQVCLATPVPTTKDQPALGITSISTSIVVSAAEFSEGAWLTATLSAPSPMTITVDYSTVGGTATAGSDYLTATGTLTFSPGIVTQFAPVPILDDELDENNETVNTALYRPSNAGIGLRNLTTLIILDDDNPPTVDFDRQAYETAEEAGTALITVTLDVPSGLGVTVNYSSTDGTATAWMDYTPVTDTLTFAPGIASQTFTVPVIFDEMSEVHETVILTLVNPQNANVGPNSPAILTILGDYRIYLPLVIRAP